MRPWLPVVALFALSACTTERPSDIASISIDGRACDVCSTHVSIDRDGRVREPVAPLDVEILAYLDRAHGDAFEKFPYDEFESARGRAEIDGPSDVVMLSVLFRDGSVRRAPVVPLQTHSTRTGALAAWTVSTAFEADRAMLGDRRRVLDEAIARQAVRPVILEELGCYGSCARYTAMFATNGTATIDVRCRDVVRRGHVRIAFARVLDAAPELRWLRPVYPVAAVDTEAARITIATRTQTFVSYGPDRTTWDAPFTNAETRLDQLVNDLPWQPNVKRPCAIAHA